MKFKKKIIKAWAIFNFDELKPELFHSAYKDKKAAQYFANGGKVVECEIHYQIKKK